MTSPAPTSARTPRSLFATASRATGFLLRFVDRTAEFLIVVLFAGIVLVGGLQVARRYLFDSSLSWSEEFQRYGLIWIVFLALVAGYRRGVHIGMEFLARKLPGTIQSVIGWITDLLWLSLGLAMVVFTVFQTSAAGMTFLASVARQRSAGMNAPMHLIYGCVVAGGVYLTLAAIHNLLQRAGGATPALVREETDPC